MRHRRFPWVRMRTGIEEDMTRRTTRAAQAAAATATNPATQCTCGTIRTPGVQHTKGDTGPMPKGLGAAWCNK